MWHVYVLESKIYGNKYTGITNDLKRRFAMHNTGKVLKNYLSSKKFEG